MSNASDSAGARHPLLGRFNEVVKLHRQLTAERLRLAAEIVPDMWAELERAALRGEVNTAIDVEVARRRTGRPDLES